MKRLAISLIAMVLASPVMAQSLPASLRPCTADHLDPVIYTQALESWGWVAIPPLERGGQASDLADAFAGLSTAEGATPTDRRTEAGALWIEQVREGLVFDGGGQTLMLTAGADAGGDSVVRCFAVLPGGALDPAFAAADARAPGQLQSDPWQHFTTTYTDYAPGQTLRVTFVRSHPALGPAGPDGFATTLTIAARAGLCPGDTPFDVALADLQAQGWTRQTVPSALAPWTDALAWTLMLPYLSGDGGGEGADTLLDLQRRAVPGLLRKVDTDTARARILTRDTSVMTLTQTRDTLGQTTRSCRVSAATAMAPEGTDFSAAPGAPATLFEVVTVLSAGVVP